MLVPNLADRGAGMERPPKDSAPLILYHNSSQFKKYSIYKSF